MCLLHILKLYASKCADVTIEAIHVHHGIRQGSADADAEFAASYCAAIGVPIEIMYRDIPGEAAVSKETCEECARRVRYEIFNNKADGSHNLIAVAHHVDDQAETVLFRMVRGTGIKGLRAMMPMNGKIIRPLLCLTREEILEYLRENELSYCVDESNEDINYSRNRIRHNVMPELQKLCPDAASHIALLSQDAREADDYLSECADKLYRESLIEESEGRTVLSAAALNASRPIIIRMALRQVIDSMTHSLKDVTREHVESIAGLLNKNEASSVNLPKKMLAVKEGDRLVISIDENAQSVVTDADDCSQNIVSVDIEYCHELDIPGEFDLPDGRRLYAEHVETPNVSDIPQNLYTKWFDYDKINPGFCVRNRREGDYIITDKAGSCKSISRYMIDAKIPKSMRDDVLLLASGSEVYWIIGYRISESAKVSESTKSTIKIEIKEN